jgi:hypothetical protein
VVGQVVEPPGQHHEPQPLRDQVPPDQRLAISTNGDSRECGDHHREEGERAGDLGAGPLGDPAQVEHEVPEIDRHPPERQLPPRAFAAPGIRVDELLLVGVAVVLDMDELDQRKGCPRHHEDDRQVSEDVVGARARADRVMGGFVQHAEHQEGDRGTHRHGDPASPVPAEQAIHLKCEQA